MHHRADMCLFQKIQNRFKHFHTQSYMPNVSTSFLAGCFPKVSEQELYRSIQAMLPRESDIQQPPGCSNKGII